MEMIKVPENGYKIIGLWISGFKRSLNISSNVLLPIKILISLIHSLFIIIRHKPKLVIGTGGYASGPVMYIAALMNIPVFIQEQNSYPGLTNRILSKYAKKIFVAYDGMEKYFKESEIILSGNPIRKSIKNINSKNKNEFLDSINFNKKLKTVLVLGGSLGADRINEFITQNLSFFEKNNLQVILQCGSRYYEKYKNFNSQFLKVLPFIKACLAMNDDKIPTGKYAVSTSNRNFEGRQGPGSRTLLASPIVAAAAAITGKITDPRKL
jgi:UDP-N-acetylglucosamine--N-acetylmuramyl-(pentapeptide) pyrophosphoryl-undecaprenol N-acetylglucosamine transferase